MGGQFNTGSEETRLVLEDSVPSPCSRHAKEGIERWLRTAVLKFFAARPNHEDGVERERETQNHEDNTKDSHSTTRKGTSLSNQEAWHRCAKRFAQIQSCHDQIEEYTKHQPVKINTEVDLDVVSYSGDTGNDERNARQCPSTVESLRVKCDSVAERFLF